ncbi:GDSL-type esterase/lipase family protein [Congregibacter litoralis]|nr:GDSL-type esterase/lipase family protein [Congregibacter litoralis]
MSAIKPDDQVHTILLYAGENDLSNGKKFYDIQEKFTELLNMLEKKFSRAKIIIIGLKFSTARKAAWPEFRQFNAFAKQWASANSRGNYIDTAWSEEENASAFFEEDGVHLNDRGYRKLLPTITEACKAI